MVREASELEIISGQRNSSQFQENTKMASADKACLQLGRIIWKKIRGSEAPSILADSNRSVGIEEINCLSRKTPTASNSQGKITPVRVLENPRDTASRYKGTILT